MTESMVEKVAWGICGVARVVIGPRLPKDLNVECQELCSLCMAEARAAMKAMREPTDKMLQAAHDGPLMADDHRMDEKSAKWLTEIWQAMADAELETDT